MTHLPGKAGARRHSPAAREEGAVGRKRPESVRRGGVRAAPSKSVSPTTHGSRSSPHPRSWCSQTPGASPRPKAALDRGRAAATEVPCARPAPATAGARARDPQPQARARRPLPEPGPHLFRASCRRTSLSSGVSALPSASSSSSSVPARHGAFTTSPKNVAAMLSLPPAPPNCGATGLRLRRLRANPALRARALRPLPPSPAPKCGRSLPRPLHRLRARALGPWGRAKLEIFPPAEPGGETWGRPAAGLEAETRGGRGAGLPVRTGSRLGEGKGQRPIPGLETRIPLPCPPWLRFRRPCPLGGTGEL